MHRIYRCFSSKNINKDSLFNVDERIEIIINDIKSLSDINSKITVVELSGLLTTFAQKQKS